MKLAISLDELRRLGITKASDLNKTYEWVTTKVENGQINNTPDEIIKAVANHLRAPEKLTSQKENIVRLMWIDYRGKLLESRILDDIANLNIAIKNYPPKYFDTVTEQGITYDFIGWETPVLESNTYIIKARYKDEITGKYYTYKRTTTCDRCGSSIKIGTSSLIHECIDTSGQTYDYCDICWEKYTKDTEDKVNLIIK